MIPFTDPFRYVPHPLVRKAAREVIERLDRQIAEGLLSSDIAKGFTDGKMLGVLVCHSEKGHPVCLSEEGQSPDVGILFAFSGNVGGTGIVEGFVPPIFDLTLDGGHYRTHEAEITAVNKEIERLGSVELEPLTDSLQEALEARDRELEELREMKKGASGIAESQFANGQIKRAKDRWKAVISEKESKIQEVRTRISGLKKQRAAMSDELQRWIFSQYIVHNASGEKASILEVFQNQGLMPPGGTGDCAAPKLLNFAFRNGLTPVAMGEFWYGKSPATAVRTHGHFYPSCTSKCGPLLGFMMRGLNPDVLQGPQSASADTPCPGVGMSLTYIQHLDQHPQTEPSAKSYKAHSFLTFNAGVGVIYEDEDIIVAVKPSGMPSVPGLDGRQSLQEWLIERNRSLGLADVDVRAVHRLDMDTSGVIVFAKSAKAEVDLKRQFEEHTVRKTYMARLSPVDPQRFTDCTQELRAGDKGRMEIPLSPDYDERPRQKVDHVQGKPALTEYEVVSVNDDGTTDILFYPHTGRTHQLRVHAAHLSGLGRPILGDLLYGGCGSVWSESCEPRPSRNSNAPMEYHRLHLHAHSITLCHPSTGEPLSFRAPLSF